MREGQNDGKLPKPCLEQCIRLAFRLLSERRRRRWIEELEGSGLGYVARVA
jgi:hypothetical protein